MIAIAEVDEVRGAQGFKEFPQARRYRDFRKLLDAHGKQLDLVIVNTPDHTHFPATYAAMERGIAVHTQKPLTQEGGNVELHETINDIESMAHLGHYYADKMRGAAKLALFREDIRQKKFNAEAVAHLKDATDHWKAYAAIVSSQYKTQLLARTNYMDWDAILKEVEKEPVTVAREGDYPDICFTNLKDDQRLTAGTELKVKVDADDKDGIREVKLYLDGLLLNAEKSNKPYTWSGSSDELLKALKPGVYQLKAVAEDNTGTFGWQEIQIAVGDVSHKTAKVWEDEIHQVILTEGERLMEGDVRNFPRLECDLKINEDGRLVLHGVIPGKSSNRVLFWKSEMYKDPQGSHYATVENGQLVLYRGTPENPEATPFKTPSVSGPGPYKLGITVSKKLVVYREVKGEKRKTVWMSN